MHQCYTKVFDQRLAKVSPKFFDRISTVYRHPPTGGVCPHNPQGEDGENSIHGLIMSDLIKQCVPRTLHETYCAANRALPHPNLRERMKKSAEWRDQVIRFHEFDPEQARASLWSANLMYLILKVIYKMNWCYCTWMIVGISTVYTGLLYIYHTIIRGTNIKVPKEPQWQQVQSSLQ